MNKIMSGFLTLCLVAALGAGAQAKDNSKSHGHGMGDGMGMGMGHMHRCPGGKHWVKGYTNKNGKHVKGYCR
ncbi:MAG: hypothetical protein M3N49_06315 [Candidatus Eremiobacteraeota bacterium]|nr:hypothetical protein [Candidatus Eremiobacteraeota bacterium]